MPAMWNAQAQMLSNAGKSISTALLMVNEKRLLSLLKRNNMGSTQPEWLGAMEARGLDVCQVVKPDGTAEFVIYDGRNAPKVGEVETRKVIDSEPVATAEDILGRWNAASDPSNAVLDPVARKGVVF